jgi:hypothetical protein
MALSMDEQRVLAEIERRLAADDPGLATCLTSFRRPGPASVLRSPRARIVGSLFTVLLVTLVSLMVYAMIPFRAHGARTTPTAGSSSQGTAVITATGTDRTTASTPPVAANASAAGAGLRLPTKNATPSAGTNSTSSSSVKPQAAGQNAPTAAGP